MIKNVISSCVQPYQLIIRGCVWVYVWGTHSLRQPPKRKAHSMIISVIVRMIVRMIVRILKREILVM